MKSITTFVLVAVLSALSVQAQPTPRTIADRAIAAYEASFSGVNSYLVTTKVMGTSSTIYAERVSGDQVDFHTYTVLPNGDLHEDNDLVMSFSHEGMLEVIGDRGHYVGEDTIDGVAVYIIRVEDVEDLMDPEDLPEADDFEFDAATFYFGVNNRFVVGVDAHGVARHNESDAEITVQIRFSEFETVSGLTWPHVTTIHLENMDMAISEEELRELQELRAQLADMPAEQRRMIESMMGDSLAMLDQMVAGEGVTIESRVTDLQVNVPRP